MSFAVRLTLCGLLQLAAGLVDSVTVGRYTSFRQVNTLQNPEGTIPKVWATGRNDYGQLGTGSAWSAADSDCWAEVHLPSLHAGEETIAVAAGAFHTLFLTSKQRLFGVGRNNHGQLGSANESDVIFSSVLEVAAGYAHTLMRSGAGVYAMGWNAQGQLGTNDTEDRSTPTLVFDQVSFGAVPISIAAGHDFSFVVADDQAVYAFGNNLGGQLGIGSRMAQLAPVKVQSLVGQGVVVRHVAAGSSHAIFETTQSRWFGTGSNFVGQLAGATAERGSTDVPVELLGRGPGARAAGDSTCEAGEGRLDCTGDNSFGQLGLGEQAFTTEFVKVHEVDDWTYDTQTALGTYHSLFLQLRNDSSGPSMNLNYVWATGANHYSQLGDCTADPRNTWQVSWTDEEGFFNTTTLAPTSTATTTTVTTATTTRTTSTPEPNVTTSQGVIETTSRGIREEDNTWMLILGGVGVAAIALVALLTCLLRPPAVAEPALTRQPKGTEMTGHDEEAPREKAKPNSATLRAQARPATALLAPAEAVVHPQSSLQVPMGDAVSPTVSQKRLASSEEEQAAQLIREVYQRQNPSELAKVNEMLQEYTDSKVAFYKRICEKYGEAPVEFRSEVIDRRAAELIRGVYERHNPAKIGHVSSLLSQYTGPSRVTFYRRVCEKYGETPVDLMSQLIS